MDRNTLTGLVLIALLIIGWSVYVNMNQPDPAERGPAVADSLSAANEDSARLAQADSAAGAKDTAAAPEADTALVAETARDEPGDSATVAARARQTHGDFAPLVTGEEQQLTVVTPLARVRMANTGSLIRRIRLRKFETFDGKPLELFPEARPNFFGFSFNHRGKVINTAELYYNASETGKIGVEEGEQKTVSFTAGLSGGRKMEHRFTFYGDKYAVDYDVVLHNMGQTITDNALELSAGLNQPETERSRENMIRKTSVYWQLYDPEDPADGEVDDLGTISDEPEKEQIGTPLKWISFKSQFFNLTFIADRKYENGRFVAAPLAPELGIQRQTATARLPLDRNRAVDTVGLRLYAGPNDSYILDDYNLAMDRLVDLGWGPIRFINYGIMAVFKSLENHIASYGVIILILAFLVKIVLSPLTFKSFKSSAKMQVVNKMPEIKELEEKYKDDPTKLQQEKMKFYGTVGVSPLGGCLPLLLQLPILVAMFNFFPNSIELRQQAFLWAEDLSTYDAFFNFNFEIPFLGDHLSLFTLLWVFSQLGYTIIQQQTQSQPANAPKFMKYFPYLMPIVLLGIFNNYSSGLSYYYLVFNLITISQTFITKRFFIDEDKLHDDIHAIKTGKKKAKKGGIAGWLQKQQEKQQEVLAARQADQGGRQGRRQHQQQQKKKKKKRK